MKTPRAELLCVGTELLMGKVNAHASFISREIEKEGFSLRREITVGDDRREMETVFKEAWRRSDVIIVTGGLGPTFDDITRDVWAKVLRRPLVFNSRLARDIEARFRLRGYKMPRENLRQARVIRGADVMENPQGTAPGQIFHSGKKILALFPGPGREMRPMFTDAFLPFLRGKAPHVYRRTNNYRIFGIPESVVDEKLQSLIRRVKSNDGSSALWGILAQKSIVEIKVTVSSKDEAVLRDRLKFLHKKIMSEFGKDVFGFGNETLEEVVGRLLVKRGETLSTAESCTGGLVSQKITGVPGSSDYFFGGFVTYCDDGKRRFLGVKAETLRKYGAVSSVCAREMAEGCRRRFRTVWATAVTGIAGPGGGREGKPVGRVFLAVSGPGGTTCEENSFFGDRDQIREKAALQVLHDLWKKLKND